MVQRVEGRARSTVAADKGYDTKEFVRQMRADECYSASNRELYPAEWKRD